MKSRRILVISYPYPPMPTVGANRWLAMTKYLRRRGHRVDVLTTSAFGSTASSSWLTATGHPARLGGSNVGGPTSVTSAPRAEKASTSDRATRECDNGIAPAQQRLRRCGAQKDVTDDATTE